MEVLRCDPNLLVGRGDRGHSAAEYLADVASAAGADTSKAALELSATLFEVFELVRQRPPSGAVELVLRAGDGGVEIAATLPGDLSFAEAYLGWARPITDTRDPLSEPEPGDGLRELAALHGVEIDAEPLDEAVRLLLRVPLHDVTSEASSSEEGSGR